jgi:hypothetical protein
MMSRHGRRRLNVGAPVRADCYLFFARFERYALVHSPGRPSPTNANFSELIWAYCRAERRNSNYYGKKTIPLIRDELEPVFDEFIATKNVRFEVMAKTRSAMRSPNCSFRRHAARWKIEPALAPRRLAPWRTAILP